jgi:hypothetical protein
MNHLSRRDFTAIQTQASKQLTSGHADLVAGRAQRPAASRRIDLPLVSVTGPPPPQQVIRAPDGRWLVASRFDLDPATQTRGATYAPKRVMRRLDALIEAGVQFDLIYVLDELPAEWEPGSPVPEMRPIEEHRAKQIVALQETTFAAGLTAATMVGRGVRAAGSGLAVGAGAVAEAVAYDPALIGGVADPSSGQVAWLLIDRWDEVNQA